MRKILWSISLTSVIPIVFLIISQLFWNGQYNEIIYQCLVPLEAIIVPLIVVYLQNKESELRKEKRAYYKNLIDIMTVKFSKFNELDETINIEFCKEINKLALYASKEIIDYIKKIQEKKNGDPKELLALIRKDLINTNLENLDKDIMLDFQYSSVRGKKNV